LSGGFAIHLTPDAATQIADAESWWRANRLSAPDALTDELNRTLDDLDVFPDAGQPVPDAKLRGVRRIYIKRVHYHLYFRVTNDRRAIDILAFWHASRGAGPPL
jgi:plasmid stabilization system protein ParE